MTKNKIIKFKYLLPFALILSPASRAEESNTSLINMTLEELLNVTVVSLFEESELATSSSVYIVEESEWLKKGLKRTNEIMALQPSAASYSFLGGSNAFAIRGYANRISTRGTATLLDGVPLNSYSFGTAQYLLPNFDLGALSRAELIRGPGSAIHGSDAFHGVFALQSFSAEGDTLETELGAGSDSYTRFNTRFAHSFGPTSKLTGVIASTYQGDSQIEFNVPNLAAQGIRKEKYDSQTGLLKYASNLNQNWTTELGIYFNQFNSDDFPSIGTIPLGAADISDGESQFEMIRANIERKFSQQETLTIDLFRWQTEQTFFYTIPSVPSQSQDDRRQGIKVTYKDTGSENENRWLIGTGFNRQKITSALFASGRQPFDGLEREIINLFAQLRIPFFDNKIALDLGARLDDYSDFGSQTTPRLGVIYQPDDNTAWKFLFGNAFRAPVGGELTFSGLIQGNPQLKPETIDTYEFVYLNKAGNNQTGITLFYSQWKDAIVVIDDLDQPAPFTQRYVNQGEFESQGLELEYRYIGDSWGIDSSLSFVDSRNVHTDESFVAFPESILQVSMDYQLPNSNFNISFSNQLWFNVQGSPIQSSDDLGTIWNSNFHLSYDYSPQLELRVDIRDLFNRKNNVPSLWGNPDGLPTKGIEVATYISYRW
ncbi:TonB-dependent receptor plug domain-containing protein [Aliikangiella marina]|uniref:TonB-dependent receptor plug domain-containing protein n=1 Tax=Aliikangiella marina TaxID=1712262 RepID=UPI00163DB03C|nr:TonB-dependent receptor [Aliikangiella marina]